MSVMHIVAEPLTVHDKLIDVYWDEEAGTVTGQGADYIMRLSKHDRLDFGPQPPGEYKLSKEPLRNRTDMAVIIAQYHRLPEVLQPYYPEVKWKPLPSDVEVTY